MENTILQVPIEDIIPNRFQPRLSFDDASLSDLATSIKEHGIIQPLVLRRKNDKYEIIAGERRYKAARIAGLASVPAIISNLDDKSSAEVAIIENIQRKDLTAIEEAKSFQALLDKGYMTQEELARKMGLSQSAVSNKLRLLSLDEAVQNAVVQGKISERHARSLLKIDDHEKQKELLSKVINNRLTVKALEDEIKNIKEKETVNINPVNFARPVDNNVEMLGPEKMPEPVQNTNKFFNSLESSAANMNLEEPESISFAPATPEATQRPTDLLSKTDNIEMLDDFAVPETATNNDYLNYVIKTVRGLNLDSDKVVIEEMNLPTEYLINIKIKKDKI